MCMVVTMDLYSTYVHYWRQCTTFIISYSLKSLQPLYKQSSKMPLCILSYKIQQFPNLNGNKGMFIQKELKTEHKG